jgi:hypothetical protein
VCFPPPSHSLTHTHGTRREVKSTHWSILDRMRLVGEVYTECVFYRMCSLKNMHWSILGSKSNFENLCLTHRAHAGEDKF